MARPRRNLLGLTVLLVLTAQEGLGQPALTRDYVAGDRGRYELSIRVSGARGELFAVSEHRSLFENGVGFEEIRWLTLTETVMGDLSGIIADSEPMRLSLDPAASTAPAPTVDNAGLQMLVDSLHLIYLAVHPKLGAAELSKPGDQTQGPIYVEDGFESGGSHLERWAAKPWMRLESLKPGEARVRTDFIPPLSGQWEPLRDWMTMECGGGGPPSFEVVEFDDPGFVVAWGCDESKVTTTLLPENGKILFAELQSNITYARRWCAEEDLTGCKPTVYGTKAVRATLTLKPPEPQLPPERLTENAVDGLEYALIPAGVFQMGCVPGDEDCYERELPRRSVEISRPFWLGRTEVPVEAYERFAAASNRAMPPAPQGLPNYNDDWQKKRHPMVKVTWEEAQAYCEWAGGRLPTEAEWERAARGGLEGLKYSRSNERSHEEANAWGVGGRDHWEHTAPVASFPANPYGLYDMTGNVFEWTADWFDEYYYRRAPSKDPKGPASGDQRSVRGGSGFINPAVLRISTRLPHTPNSRNLNVGFRCVLER